MKNNQFVPSFFSHIKNFESLVKCRACACFEKTTSHGLCKLCCFYAQQGMYQYLIKQQQYTLPSPATVDTFDNMLNLLVESMFGFESLHENQRDAITAYVSGKDTFVIMPTGSGKSLCYW